MSFYTSCGKRAFDIIAVAGAMVVLSPLFLVLSLIIAITLGRPILFFQERSGWKGQPFRMVKFRSMIAGVDDAGRVLPDHERLTPFGLSLRASSLDELPALWNVLMGEMSIVGPRPLHVHYDSLYSPEQAHRLQTKPGITGWAQINGRNALSWPSKFALDVWYVDNKTLKLDMKIILATVRVVFARDGISAADSATMPAFEGEKGPSAPTDSLSP